MWKKRILLASLLVILLSGVVCQEAEEEASQASQSQATSTAVKPTPAPVESVKEVNKADQTDQPAADSVKAGGDIEKTVTKTTTTSPEQAPSKQTTESTTAENEEGKQDPSRVDPRQGAGGNITIDDVKEDAPMVLMWSGDLNPDGACNMDKGIYCGNIKYGEQRVLRCLTLHIVRQWDGADDAVISIGCMEEMMDYKIHHTQSINGDMKLAKSCTQDAKKFCTNPERYQGSGRGGAVVACLRNHHEALQPACQEEIFRVMREAAYDFRLDASLHEKCESEVEKHCSKTPPGEGRVVDCLHKAAFHDMEDNECKKEILRQLRETSTDVRLNYHLYHACNYEMQKFCRGIQPGHEKMQICLADNRDEQGFGNECKEAVIDLLHHLIDDAQEDKRLTEGCAQDLKDLCDFDEDSEVADHGAVLQCLAKNRNKLHESCIGEVSRLLQEQFRNIKLNPKLQAACGEDIQAKCSDVPKDEGLTVDCLVKQRDDLTENCKKLLFQQRVVRNENINYNLVLQKACAKDHQMFCKDVVVGEGRVINCLMQNFEDQRMSMNCKKALSGLARDEAEDYRLDPQLKKACTADAKALCKEVCDPEDDAENCDGKIIACLEYHSVEEEGGHMEIGTIDEDPVNHDSKVSEECQRALGFRIKMQAVDFRNNEVLADACRTDAETICTNREKDPIQPGDGRVFECLFEHYSELSEDCQEEEFKFKVLQSESINRLPHLLKVCQMEMAFFCSKVEPTGSHVMKCLEENLESSPSHFGGECKEALSKRAKNLQNDFRFDEGLFKHCKKASKKYDCPKIKPKNINSGKIFMCLVENYDSLLNDDDGKCASEMSRVVRQMFFHYQKDAPVTRVCDADLESICANMDEKIARHAGKYTRCLGMYLKENDTMPTPECHALVAIGKTQGKSDDKEKFLKEQIERSKANQQKIEENLKVLNDQLREAQAQKATTNENMMDKNTVVGAVALFGFLIIAAIVGAVWAIRKYLNKGYMVLKSGDV